MASFCNPMVFESPAHFRKYYDRPILAGREPGATDKQVQLATERQEEMNRHCNDFILRRTNDILSDHLPPKVNTEPVPSQHHCSTSWTNSAFCCDNEHKAWQQTHERYLQPQDSVLIPLTLSSRAPIMCGNAIGLSL